MFLLHAYYIWGHTILNTRNRKVNTLQYLWLIVFTALTKENKAFERTRWIIWGEIMFKLAWNCFLNAFQWDLVKSCFQFITELLHSFRIKTYNNLPWVWEKIEILSFNDRRNFPSTIFSCSHKISFSYFVFGFALFLPVLPHCHCIRKPRLCSHSLCMHFSFCKHRGTSSSYWLSTKVMLRII